MKEFGVTGTKERITVAQEKALLPVMRMFKDRGFNIQNNGDCINADYWMAWTWRRVGGTVWGHPPINPTYRAWFAFDGQESPAEYRKRNHAIVQASSALLAIPKTMGMELRSGTWMTVRMAREKKIPILFVWPDGKIEWDVYLGAI